MAVVAPDTVHQSLNELLADGALCIVGQVATDEVFAKIVHGEWTNSAARRSLFQNWAKARLSDYEADCVLSRLDIGAQRGDVDYGTLVRVLRVAIENGDWPLPARSRALFIVGNAHRSSVDGKGEIFSLLISQISDAKLEKLQYAAACSLRNFVTLDQAQMTILATVKEHVTNKKVASVIEQALARGQKGMGESK
jgi:hypothetical protein